MKTTAFIDTTATSTSGKLSKLNEYACPTDVKAQPGCYLLPDHHTLEAEALGAITFSTGEGHNSYVSNPLYHSLSEAAQGLFGFLRTSPDPSSDVSPLDSPRIRECLAKAGRLVSEGEYVVYEVSGPLSVLNCLLDTDALMRSFKRESQLLDSVLTAIRASLVLYIRRIVASGVKHISIADPICSVYTIGPKAKENYIRSHLLPLLQEIKETSEGEFLLHLCPKLFLDLERSGLCRAKYIKVPGRTSFGRAYELALGRTDLVGQECIKRTAEYVSDGSLKSLIIPNAESER